ncbi:Uncharacterised protein [Mycobacteroides abscessus subsp. massiliense]|uniref:SU10 major capsid protein n=1 Tax=Mycobacteroides abscessus TaxID=36809 RepID=UPI0009A5E5AD|nr:DUF5309 family protein [Mycobacteroides abscessus]SKH54323.1 Uncharacterised protein [Mycobacteroides abscessus subsp. massiliense]SKH84880.1 Uncharacterised protein [Mycobacteroides abscessus subsp. massiliense]SKK33189.1 Uncharacterised protein [Mycobacteroides abscessus subsp. massiliense]SKK46410.1 Uncharacterised protein [Mycobacteroides abscessus subsp. massiliense]SKL87865.1 Uncharacterised protein [Mycobacteroides abscessus subsp. massiliense]
MTVNTITGAASTFNSPNYTGLLFQISPLDTPFFSAIGAFSEPLPTTSTAFQWQTEGIESSSTNNAKLEGAPAPAATEVGRLPQSNVVEIHHESFEVTYTKQAAVGQLSGLNTADGSNPVQDEVMHQSQLKLLKIAKDLNKSFLNGVYANPNVGTSPRQTCGIFNAVLTNVFANGGTKRAITKAIVDGALANIYQNGPLSPASTMFVVNPAQKIALTNLYGQMPLNHAPLSRDVGGLNIQTLVTDFGDFGILIDRDAPTDRIGIVDLAVCAPRFLSRPGHPLVTAEPLAKTGSSDKYQIYCEAGLQYGPETYHGVIGDLLNPLTGS